MNRRQFALACASLSTPSRRTAHAEQLLKHRITGPQFPDRHLHLTKFGARNDRVSKSSGTIHLESNGNLYLSEGATLLFSQDPEDYLPAVFTRFEGTECINYSPFAYAFEKSNIGVSGPGILDGQASDQAWWPWANNHHVSPNADADRKALVAMGDNNIPVQNRVFGPGHYLRPNFIQPYRGGIIDTIVFHKVNVGQVAEAAIDVDFFYEEGPGGPFKPVVKNVDVIGVTCAQSRHAIFMRGFPGAPISGVSIFNLCLQ